MPHFIFNELNLHYLDRGEGPTLLLIPGSTASAASHAEDIELLAARHRVLALDPPGVGGSDRLADWPAYYWQLSAAAGAALLNHLSLGPAHVLGVSGGAISALWMAIEHGGLVRSVSADSIVEMWPAEAIHASLAARWDPPEELRGFWLQAHGEDWAEVVASDGRLLAGFGETGLDCFNGRLGEIACPVLFTASLMDEELPDVAGQLPSMAGRIAGARCLLANVGSHPLIWTAPEVFFPALRAFLEGMPD